MSLKRYLFFSLVIIVHQITPALSHEGFVLKNKNYNIQTLDQFCVDMLKSIPGASKTKDLKEVCGQAMVMSGCHSHKLGHPIFHVDKVGISEQGKRILVFALVHGDEGPSGSVARYWLNRLQNISSRNSWRIIPVMNPEGFYNKTRMNGRGVDLNRNMPTKNWDQLALKFWKLTGKSSKRRFPGESAASEQEVKCMMNHISQFRPDFIISVHTPYGLLDFDGPTKKVALPKFDHLPWKRMGHYPGSLGRYAWKERNIPVLTIELKGNVFNQPNSYLSRLQDIAGTMAIISKK